MILYEQLQHMYSNITKLLIQRINMSYHSFLQFISHQRQHFTDIWKIAREPNLFCHLSPKKRSHTSMFAVWTGSRHVQEENIENGHFRVTSRHLSHWLAAGTLKTLLHCNVGGAPILTVTRFSVKWHLIKQLTKKNKTNYWIVTIQHKYRKEGKRRKSVLRCG